MSRFTSAAEIDMHASPDFDTDIAFALAFADVGQRWQLDSDRPSLFDRHLGYAESIPVALLGAARNLLENTPVDRRPVFPEIVSGLVDSAQFNCFARRHSAFDRYFAGMSAIIPLATLELACHHFSFQHLFIEIGDPEQGPLVRLDATDHPPLFQIAEGHIVPLLSCDVDDERAAGIGDAVDAAARKGSTYRRDAPKARGTDQWRHFDTVLELMMPRCPVRRMHCEYMSYALLHFLWIHEISHITNGHLIELRDRTGSAHANFHEFSLGQFANSPLTDNIDCLAMEFDADIEAATIMLSLIMSDIDIEDDDAPFVSRHERASIFVFALVAFYSSVAARELASARLGTHPPALLRLENILIHLSGAVMQEGDLQHAIATGYHLYQAHAEHARYTWAPGSLLGNGALSIGKGKWWNIYQHRREIATGYDRHRLGNLRVFLSSLDDELRGSTLFHMGLQPTWWNKGP